MGCQQKGGGALPLLVNSAVAGGDGDLIGEGGDDGHTGDVSNLSDEDQGEGDRGAGRGEAACRGGRGLMLRTWVGKINKDIFMQLLLGKNSHIEDSVDADLE